MFSSAPLIAGVVVAATTEEWIRGNIIIAAGIIGAFVVRLVRKLMSGQNTLIGSLIGRIVGSTILAVGFVYGLNAVGVAIGPLLGALGVAGFAVAFALQGILSNVLAGVLIQIRRPFEIAISSS